MKRAFSRVVTMLTVRRLLSLGNDLTVRCKSSFAFVIAVTSLLQISSLHAADSEEGFQIEEVIVTATKRLQSIQDIAMSVSALTEEAIDKQGLLEFNDYLRTLPGVNVVPHGAGRNKITIRGTAVNPQLDDDSVGVYFGETPITGFGSDLRLVDINRVELLRGPQGTLYGAGSLGGALRIIPNTPNFDGVHGSILAGYSHTGEKGSGNNGQEGIINIPLIDDVLAVRATAYRIDDSGIYENIAASDPVKSASAVLTTGVVRDRDDIGATETVGGRIAVLYRPIDKMEAKLTYTRQDIDQDGVPNLQLDLGDFRQTRYETTNGQEGLAADIEMVNFQLDYDFGWVSAMSSTTWVDTRFFQDRDVGIFFTGLFGGLDMPVTFEDNLNNEVITEEFRLTSQLDGPFQFITGVFYSDADQIQLQQTAWAGDPAADPFAGANISNLDITKGVKQLSLFGEASYDVLDSVTVTVGVRHFDYDRDDTTIRDGVANGGFSSISTQSEETGETYKADIKYRPNEDMTFYVSWSEGFRIGEPLAPLAANCDVDNDGLLDGIGIPSPTQLDSDSLESWEIGSKMTLLDGRFSLNAALYDIDWKDIPVAIFLACGNAVQLNAGKVSSRGIEVEGQAYLSDSLFLNYNAAYTDTELAEDQAALGMKGDRLPGIAKHTYGLGLEYRFEIAGKEAFLRSDYNYVGSYRNFIGNVGPGVGNYHQLNFRAGILIDKIALDLFVKNVTNNDALTFADTVFPNARAVRLRPRIIGVQARYRF